MSPFRHDEDNPLVTYQYDALNRRITEDPGTATDLYYSAAWQVLEERVGGTAKVQYVWSPVYVDALVLRDRDTDGNGTLEERLWVQQDANWNVTALVDSSGNVVERYVYDAYGTVTVLAANWTAQGSSSYAWRYQFQGGRFDSISGLISFRYRDFSPTLGRWLQLDPIGYAAGNLNLYLAFANNSQTYLDPTGLTPLPPDDLNLLIEWFVHLGMALDAAIERAGRIEAGAIADALLEAARRWKGTLPTVKIRPGDTIKEIRPRPTSPSTGGKWVRIGRIGGGLLLVGGILWILEEDGKNPPVPGARRFGKREYELQSIKETWELPDGTIICVTRDGLTGKITNARACCQSPKKQKR